MNNDLKILTYKNILSLLTEETEADGLIKAKEINNVIRNLELSNLFQIPIEGPYLKYGNGWIPVGRQMTHRDYFHLGKFGVGTNRCISWSDDGEQPGDEWLLSVCFSSGAYIFGDSYPEDLFNEFFQELKSFGPKYCDTVNHHLYFSHENANLVFNSFPEIFKKYCLRVSEEFKKNQKQKLLDKLARLED